jgi:argininosuccinate lyase
MALLTTMKGLPLTYNRDLQEDKEGLFDTVDTLLATLEAMTGMISTLTIRADKAAQAIKQGCLLATDLADYLVKKGEPFRTAHDIVARLVSYAIGQGKTLEELSLEAYKQYSPRFGDDVYALTVESSLAARDNIGGTAPKQVEQALTNARKILEENLA